jgi:ribosome modulation factor
MAESHDPGLDSTEALRIRTAGRQASDAGKPVTACPYPEGTEANYQWVSGWAQPHATAPEDAS